MILLCGIPSEPPMKLLIDAAEALGSDYLLFDQRESQFTELSLRLTDSLGLMGTLQVRGAEYDLESFGGVFVRLMDHRELPEHRLGSGATIRRVLARSTLLHNGLLDWLELTDARVMNRASAMASNQSKPFQAQAIARAGFRIPETLVTNDSDEVRAFKKLHGRIIYKSISAVRSIVRLLDEPSNTRLDRLRYLPTQFQAYVSGTNFRVHTTGDDVFATEIVSKAVDYRYASRDGLALTMRPVELPADVRQRCLKLSQELRLPLAGIDLKRTEDGEWFCFEVNPCPAYSYYQKATDQPIAAGVIRWLCAESAATQVAPKSQRSKTARAV